MATGIETMQRIAVLETELRMEQQRTAVAQQNCHFLLDQIRLDTARPSSRSSILEAKLERVQSKNRALRGKLRERITRDHRIYSKAGAGDVKAQPDIFALYDACLPQQGQLMPALSPGVSSHLDLSSSSPDATDSGWGSNATTPLIWSSDTTGILSGDVSGPPGLGVVPPQCKPKADLIHKPHQTTAKHSVVAGQKLETTSVSSGDCTGTTSDQLVSCTYSHEYRSVLMRRTHLLQVSLSNSPENFGSHTSSLVAQNSHGRSKDSIIACITPSPQSLEVSDLLDIKPEVSSGLNPDDPRRGDSRHVLPSDQRHVGGTTQSYNDPRAQRHTDSRNHDRNEIFCEPKPEKSPSREEEMELIQSQLMYRPRYQSSDDFRTVIATNIALDSTLSDVLGPVCGGTVLSVSYMNTVSITGSNSALITFLRGYAARQFIGYITKKQTSVHNDGPKAESSKPSPIIYRLLDSFTRPVSREMKYLIGENRPRRYNPCPPTDDLRNLIIEAMPKHTRCISIANLSSKMTVDSLKEVLSATDSQMDDGSIVSTSCDPSGVFHVEFTSIMVSQSVYSRISQALCEWDSESIWQGAILRFEKDPCDRPVPSSPASTCGQKIQNAQSGHQSVDSASVRESSACEISPKADSSDGSSNPNTEVDAQVDRPPIPDEYSKDAEMPAE